MRTSKILFCAFNLILFSAQNALALQTGTVEVMSQSANPVNDLIYAAKTQNLPPLPIPNGPRGLSITLMMNCFGTNNRVVQYPLSPLSEIQFETKILGNWVAVAFPAIYVAPNPVVNPAASPASAILAASLGASNTQLQNANPGDLQITNPANIASANLSPHNLQIITKNIDMSTLVAADGTIPVGVRSNAIQKLSFKQNVISGNVTTSNDFDWDERRAGFKSSIYASLFSAFGKLQMNFASIFESKRALAGGGDGSTDGGNGLVTAANAQSIADGGYLTSPPALAYRIATQNFVGNDSFLTSSLTTAWSGDMSHLQINASFPGVDGFCGGFRSPLMFFFDDGRPQFSNHVGFRLNEVQTQTNWVEPGAPGFFLALDRNHDGVINDGGELFGDIGGANNGFEDLAFFDSNHDGVIDAKDPVFKDLLLWQDKNGDGISQPNELVTLKSKNIESISLGYQEGKDRVGQTAELRQRAPFAYRRGNGKLTTGQVVDVWFAGGR